MQKYNTRVREAMSEEYVKSSKKKAKLQRQYEKVLERLDTEASKLCYNEYITLQKRAED